ncbi:MAG: hypothetical protein ACM3ZE_09825, partial [Myxococcales bacterium]
MHSEVALAGRNLSRMRFNALYFRVRDIERIACQYKYITDPDFASLISCVSSLLRGQIRGLRRRASAHARSFYGSSHPRAALASTDLGGA